MRFFQFGTRRAMIGIAALCIILGAYEMNRRRLHYLEQSEFHAEAESRWLKNGEAKPTLLSQLSGRAARWGESVRRYAAYHAELKHKYERASRYPWLPVAPDPPRPY